MASSYYQYTHLRKKQRHDKVEINEWVDGQQQQVTNNLTANHSRVLKSLCRGLHGMRAHQRCRGTPGVLRTEPEEFPQGKVVLKHAVMPGD
ncbi:hypothetical protein DPMN_113131 [Dreissena polymorpha]|uniref:Uncharacterized protein n=1 Tax=Dreissena polymorpha TaxID=45954 RepID=A0A9D4QQP0_DREPO|nr:hypothetical protein DPMN_113131 [Dreissena polymorpha]